MGEHERILETWRRKSRQSRKVKKKVNKFVTKHLDHRTVESILISPVQKLPKLKTLLENLNRIHPGRFHQPIQTMKKVLNTIDYNLALMEELPEVYHRQRTRHQRLHLTTPVPVPTSRNTMTTPTTFLPPI